MGSSLNLKPIKVLAVCMLYLLGTWGCAEVLDDIVLPEMEGRSRKIVVTTDPPQSRIMLEAMGSRQIKVYYSPAEIIYIRRPGMPTLLSISKEGYQSKKVRLDGSQSNIHVVLEKAIELPPGLGGRTGGVGRMGGGPSPPQ